MNLASNTRPGSYQSQQMCVSEAVSGLHQHVSSQFEKKEDVTEQRECGVLEVR